MFCFYHEICLLENYIALSKSDRSYCPNDCRCGGSVEDQRKVYAITSQYLASLLGWKGVNVFFSDFVRSGNAESLFSVLQDTISRLNKDEMELFITRICLQVFASMPKSRKGEAFSIVDSLQRNFKQYIQPSASSYLLDFIQLLIEVR